MEAEKYIGNKYDWKGMNYIIKLEARGSRGKEEVLEALRQLPYGILDQRVRVSTVVDDIVIREDIASLSVPAHLQ
jgi:hypothetical protein|tara:strand:+ start:100 stop:324 length:225 start_codon:yes stop_codon:yes gene_type:complete